MANTPNTPNTPNDQSGGNERFETPAAENSQRGDREPEPSDVTDIAGHQKAQNHNENDRYDPSVGQRPDQRRRNDKQGRMGG